MAVLHDGPRRIVYRPTPGRCGEPAGYPDGCLPLLIVQPLVENALRHGLSSRVAGGTVSITVRRIGDALVIEVADDGVGLPPGWSAESSPGTGLRNLRSRLAAEFFRRGTLELHPVPSGGVLAVVRIPYIPA